MKLNTWTPSYNKKFIRRGVRPDKKLSNPVQNMMAQTSINLLYKMIKNYVMESFTPDTWCEV